MKEELIKLNNISYSVNDEQLSLSKGKTSDILFDINFSVYENDVLGICGESGGGKSTLAKLISGLIRPSNGNLIHNKKLYVKRSEPKKIQILFQNNSNLINPYRKVKVVMEETLKLSGVKKENITKHREEIFSALGIQDEILNHRGYELSGGERQKFALARLLAVNPEVLILDEPFSAQDITSQLNLVNVFKKINEEFKVAIICISHDLKILRKFAHRVIVIQNGKIVEIGEITKIFNTPEHSYTKFLLSAEDFNLTKDEIHASKN